MRRRRHFDDHTRLALHLDDTALDLVDQCGLDAECPQLGLRHLGLALVEYDPTATGSRWSSWSVIERAV